MTGAEKLVWARDEPIAIPSEQKEGRLAIRRADWARLKREVGRVQAPRPNLPVWYSVCFGAAVSAGASIVPILVAKDLPAWVGPLYVIFTAATLIGGLVLVFLDRALRRGDRADVAELEADMKDIEEAFERGTDA